MGNFDRNRGGRDSRGGRSFGRRDFGPRNFDRSRGGGDRPMFKTICSNCGKECEVPFRPTSGKPVYCSDCFEKFGTKRDSERLEKSGFRPQSVGPDRSGFDELNAKLDKIIRLLEPKAPEVVVLDTVKVVKKEKAPKTKKAVKKASKSL